VIAVARLLVRMLGLLALIALAAGGIVLAVFCIGTGTSGPSLGRLAELLHLASLRETIGGWLGTIESPGSIGMIAGLCGAGAILLGLLLLVGVVAPRRERLVTLSRTERGVLAARRHPLAQIATVLVEQARGVAHARVRVRPQRTGGGRLAVRASRATVAGAGIAAFLLFGVLAIKQLPRPYLARRDLPLTTGSRGSVVIEPRAVERVAEVAATRDPAITRARGLYSVDDLSVELGVRRARDLADTLQRAQRRVTHAIERHDLPPMPVNVTLTGYERRNRREIR
jgi:hypothetical protein